MLNTPGERIVYFRNMLGLTRHKFSQEANIPLATLSRWELGYSKIPDKKLVGILDFLLENGIIVDINWFLSGEGLAPINAKLSQITHTNFDETAFLTLNQLKMQIPGFMVKQVTNDKFSPIINFGDYVGIVKNMQLNQQHEKVCYAIINGELVIGIFSFKDLTLSNCSNNLLKTKINIDIEDFGSVLWIAKRT